MSVYRKESNSLVPKAGLGIIDNIFNRFSSHAISNAKTTEALILRNVMYDESDGKLYKVGIDGVKGDEIKMGMKVLKSGTITGTRTISLGTTLDPSKYMVNLNVGGYRYKAADGAVSWGYGYGQGAYVSAKTDTSVTIVVSSDLTASYEIIQIAE